MTLLMRPKVKPPEPEKTRNRVGIRNVFYQAMQRGERVTLEQAIAILRAGW